MHTLAVRPANLDDLPALADLWLEKLTILASSEARMAASADVRSRWLADAAAWLTDSACCLRAICDGDEPKGFALGVRIASLPGLSEEATGAITQIAIDTHGYYAGAGRLLIDALRAWFTEQQVGRILVIAPHRYPAEQAFWRALGAVDWMDMLWLK